MTEYDVASLGAVLVQNIPVTGAMGLTVRRADANGLVLGIPLAPNINHKHTFFAGSLNAAATLAGWGLLWLAARQADVPAHIVIQDSATRYRRPGTGDCEAACAWPPPPVLEEALASIRDGRRARVTLGATVREGEKTVVEFEGRYVLLPLTAWPAPFSRAVLD